MKTCPKCKREWPDNCEQAVSIEWHDECVVCRFIPGCTESVSGTGSKAGTEDELNLIASESAKRRSG